MESDTSFSSIHFHLLTKENFPISCKGLTFCRLAAGGEDVKGNTHHFDTAPFQDKTHQSNQKREFCKVQPKPQYVSISDLSSDETHLPPMTLSSIFSPSFEVGQTSSISCNPLHHFPYNNLPPSFSLNRMVCECWGQANYCVSGGKQQPPPTVLKQHPPANPHPFNHSHQNSWHMKKTKLF